MTIAGSDSCGGAGIQADIKTFSALGVYATSVITAITAQNTMGVVSIAPVAPEMVQAQADAVLSDIKIDAIKIGMLHSPEIINTVKQLIQKYQPQHIVLDPVMIATSGDPLIKPECSTLIIKELFPLASIITPNTNEATYLTSIEINSIEDMKQAGERLLKLGAKAVLIKGGHLLGDNVTDILCQNNQEPIMLTSTKIETKNTHGTGCTLSSAIAAHLSKGYNLEDAVSKSKTYISQAILHGKDAQIGQGHGSVNHLFQPIALKKITI
ncbi:MAG: bifunctional hydroxymethylpyrimidine kinase/phosphomethylpyrimidine kinase [Bacteroidales bacterium]